MAEADVREEVIPTEMEEDYLAVQARCEFLRKSCKEILLQIVTEQADFYKRYENSVE